MFDSSTARQFALRLQSDPAFFCREVLGVQPWAKQLEVLTALRDDDRVAVRSGHGTGKSFIAAAAALWFVYAHDPAKVVTTAPTRNQVRHVLWNEIRRQHASARVPLGGKMLEERLSLGNDAFAIGLATDEPERLQGYHAEHILVILDEAPGVAESIWEAAETLLTGRVGKILAIGNPTRPVGRFRDAFRPGSGWTTVGISCLESPNLQAGGDELPYPRLVTPRWLAARKHEWGADSPLWKSRVLGEFPDDDQARLVPSDWLAASPETAPAADGAALRLGVDVARQGSDDTVFLLRDDGGVLEVETRHGWSTMQTAGRVVRLMEEHAIDPAQVYVDDTGLGAGVTDRLRELGHEVSAVLASQRADDPAHFVNRRAECFWRLRRRLDPTSGDSFALPGRFDRLRREVAALTFDYTSSGQIRIAEKARIRAQLNTSPDHADALALTFAAPRSTDPEVTIL